MSQVITLDTDDIYLVDLFRDFAWTFMDTYNKAKKSGALDGSETPTLVGKFSLIIAADQYAPLHPSNKALLNNLKHFV